MQIRNEIIEDARRIARVIMLAVLCTWVWLAPVAGSTQLPESLTYTNPIAARGADPWVIAWSNAYYFCQSRGGSSVNVARSERLQDIGKQQWSRVWTPPAGTNCSREIWAPELHYLRGNWYVYVAADDGDNAHHRMFVLQGTSQDPQAPFTLRGQLAATTDRWAIDGTVLEMADGRLYFVWSGWDGFENVAQNLYIAPMSDPTTICGERVCISRPQYDWELNGRPLINEGPEILKHGTNLFIIYSASGSWGDDYCLGQLTWTGGDLLAPESWVKKTNSVFARTRQVYGPGHCSFVRSKDGTEDWIIYHSARRPGSGWDRQVNLQGFTWSVDGSPNFGSPVAPGIPMPTPK